ncbi:hypothetical protein ACP3W1_27960, partial [Salmonella enterica]|uniref:hypothetical protein n=1 Tax=Salmonella enterica TaxID=28901 RepID=UPI003CF84EB7
YLTQRYFPDVEHWRSIWIFRDDHRSIDDLKVEFNREKEKSFELKRVGEDSFVIANAEGKVAEQPKQRHIHQYLDFF